MKLIEYKRHHNGELELVGERDASNMRTNHTYEGKLEHIHQIDSGLAIFLIKKDDIELFKNGKNDISIYSVRMKENYVGKGSVSLAHSIQSHANGLFIDEIKKILEQYSNDEYSIITASNYGQFFAYTRFIEEKDYTEVRTKQNNLDVTNISFFNPKMKEQFSWEFHNLIPIEEVLKEIDSLKVSEDVIFVHTENNVGYAARDLETLKEISGYIYKNYLIEE